VYGRIRDAVRDCDSVPGRVMKVRRGHLSDRIVAGRNGRESVLEAMTGGLCSRWHLT
jgi:hypothetical protein